MEYFGQQAAKYREELANSAPNELIKQRQEATVHRVKDEWEDRETARLRLQVEQPSPTAKVGLTQHLGIFAPEQRQGDDDLFVEELDSVDVHPFSAPPYPGYEQQMISLDTQTAKLTQQEELYTAIEQATRETKQTIQRMLDMQEVLEKELRQITEETLVVYRQQEGPPRRMPMAQEIPAMDIWKKRASQVNNQLKNLDYSLEKARSHQINLTSQAVSLAKGIAILKEKKQQGELQAGEENFGQGSLPIVLGRGLGKVKDLSTAKHPHEHLTRDPRAFLQAMTQQSKYIDYKTQSQQALALYKESTGIERTLWLKRFESLGEKEELESMISRIARISEKLQQSKIDGIRLNIIDSLRAFFVSGLKLQTVHTKIVGTLPWYLHTDELLSKNIARYVTSNAMGAMTFKEEEDAVNLEANSNGITMGDQGSNYAHCCGLISLPKNCLWTLSMTITRQTKKADRVAESIASGNSTVTGTGSQVAAVTAATAAVTSNKSHSNHRQQATSSRNSMSKLQLQPQAENMSTTSSLANDELDDEQLDGDGDDKQQQQGGSSIESLHDPTDFISIKIGPSLTSLSHIGTYYNVVNPATGTVLYDVKHMFRGDTFAYRFDFYSSAALQVEKHLAICTGIYEEYEMQDLETVSDPKNLKKTRVLSSYVKMLKVEERTGKLRETRLLEELIAVEGSKAESWDSLILTSVPQRFTREYFLRILKAEILLQQEQQKQEMLRRQQEMNPLLIAASGGGSLGGGSSNSMMADTDLVKEELLLQSKKKYLLRKRGTQMLKIEQGKDMIHQHLLLWDAYDKLWRTVLVKDCQVEWIENGLEALILHRVQEHNEGFELIGKELTINLANYKYFLAPMQQLDPEAVRKWREKKAWQEEMAAITGLAQSQVMTLETALARYLKKQEKNITRTRKTIMAQLERNIHRLAQQAAEAKEAKREIREKYLPAALLDVKKGIVSLDEDDVDEKKLIRRVAKERFLSNWMTKKRTTTSLELDVQEELVREEMNKRSKAVEQKKRQILNQAQRDLQAYKAKLYQQYKEHRAVLQKQLTFPPEVFAKAAPRAYQCEHLRTKAWGDLYTSGVRCLTCGLELNDLEKEESQLLGYGSGANVQLWQAVKQHREDENTVQKLSNGITLTMVEEERIRLEKERREMDVNERYFYDYDDLQVVYEFDTRHAKSMKAAGIFRQGAHWSNEEIAYYEEDKVLHEKLRLERAGLPETLLIDFDPLRAVEVPPPTARALDERRKATYHNTIFQIGRLHNFRKRIYEFKMKRFALISEKELYAIVVASLHRESFLLEVELQALEKDLDRTSKLLATYDKLQKLWQQASIIQHQAEREKKKAEMNRVGCWEDVKEGFDAVSLLHQEMKELLKQKVLIENKLDDYQTSFAVKQSDFETLKQAYEMNHHRYKAMRLAMPGNLVSTRYFGQVYVIAYRAEDDMVLVNLPFGKPLAKAFIYYQELVTVEDGINASEMRAMAAEDEIMQQWVIAERVRVKKERYLMQREEEHLHAYYELMDLGKYEEESHQTTIQQAVEDGYYISHSQTYHRLQRKHVTEKLNKLLYERQRRMKDYIGPPSGRPKAYSMYETYALKKTIVKELQLNFITNFAQAAQTSTKVELHTQRSLWIRDYSLKLLIDSVIVEMIGQLAAEAYQEGRQAKLYSEKKTGIYYPVPSYMQYPTYHNLAEIWNDKKQFLTKRIELLKGETNKLRYLQSLQEDGQQGGADSRDGSNSELTPEEIKQKKVTRRQEIKRQARLCSEMFAEEVANKEFYRWELKENLRERRLMKEEEKQALELRKQEQKMRKEAEAALELVGSTGAVSGGNGGGLIGKLANGSAKTADGGVKLNAALSAEIAARRDLQFSYERRRQELKELTLERRRRSEDQALMTIEDELSHYLREQVLIERQKAAYEQQFGKDSDSDKDELDATDAADDQGKLRGGETASAKQRRKQEAAEMFLNAKGEVNLAMLDLAMKKTTMKVPSWLKPPKKFTTWTTLKQNEYIKRMILVHVKELHAAKSIAREEKRLVRLENKSYTAWLKKFQVVELQELENELAYMVAEEALQDAEMRLQEISENINKLQVFCREKGEEELTKRSTLTRMETIAKQRDLEVKEADDWLTLCMKRAKNRDKLKRKLTNDCKWVDTDSINGFHQRFATELLRATLYDNYFKQVLASILTRAEIIATERRLMRLQYSLTQNHLLLLDRTRHMTNLMREIRCEDYLRMRRSALNEKFFAKNRAAILTQRFQGWIRYYYWNKGHQDAFKMKFVIIKRQLELDRQFKAQLALANKNKKVAVEADDTTTELPWKSLVHAAVRQRPLQCKTCVSYYLANQNHSMACGYHGGSYVMMCPPSCSHPGLTSLCSSHRKRRWNCCLAIEAKAEGCTRRYHTPPDKDLIYEEILSKIKQRDDEMVKQLNEEVAVAREKDYPHKVAQTKQHQVQEIEDVMVEQRDIIARFEDIKFV